MVATTRTSRATGRVLPSGRKLRRRRASARRSCTSPGRASTFSSKSVPAPASRSLPCTTRPPACVEVSAPKIVKLHGTVISKSAGEPAAGATIVVAEHGGKGVYTAITDELARRLAELTPGEIVLLHGHFASLQREVEQAAAAADLIRGWEEAAGYPGLAARAHRSGDPVRGARRLTVMGRRFAGSLNRIESLVPALTGLSAQIDAMLGPAGEAAGSSSALRDTLENYSRLLLAQMALREADSAFAAVPFAGRALADPQDTGFGAAYRRLRAGTGDMLPRYLAAAAALTGLDHHWGTSLAGGSAAGVTTRQDA